MSRLSFVEIVISFETPQQTTVSYTHLADDGHRYDSLYAHMSSIAVAQGAAVQKGDLLGYVGNTGNVYGAGGGYHLHLELRVDGSRVNPLGFVPSR